MNEIDKAQARQASDDEAYKRLRERADELRSEDGGPDPDGDVGAAQGIAEADVDRGDYEAAVRVASGMAEQAGRAIVARLQRGDVAGAGRLMWCVEAAWHKIAAEFMFQHDTEIMKRFAKKEQSDERTEYMMNKPSDCPSSHALVQAEFTIRVGQRGIPVTNAMTVAEVCANKGWFATTDLLHGENGIWTIGITNDEFQRLYDIEPIVTFERIADGRTINVHIPEVL